jgi:aromatic ring-cleaving dioxygenase
MNTESQSTVEIYHAHVADSDSVTTASTSKTQVFAKRFDRVDLSLFNEMIAWCQDNLYHGGHYEPNWHTQYRTFYFTDEREYTLFLLRWT